MFMLLFIFKLLITAFLRNCSKLYMLNCLVSESLASKLHFSDLATCFCLASYRFLFIHSSGLVWPRNPCGCMQEPQHQHTEADVTAKARGKGSLALASWASCNLRRHFHIQQHWKCLSDTQTGGLTHLPPSLILPFSSTAGQHGPAYITLHQLQCSFLSFLLKGRKLFLPNRLGQDEHMRWKHNSHLWPVTDLLCLVSVFQAAACLVFWYPSSLFSLQRKPHWRLRHSGIMVNHLTS